METEMLPEDEPSSTSPSPRFDAAGNRIQTKACTSCHATKPVTEFQRDRTQPDSLQRNCKACRKRSQARYRQSKVTAAGIGGEIADILSGIPSEKLESLARLIVQLAQSGRGDE